MKTNEPLSAEATEKPHVRLLIGGFLFWTLLLSAKTLDIQNSCSPMVKWQNTLVPEYCKQNPAHADFLSKVLPSKDNDIRTVKPNNSNSGLISLGTGVIGAVGVLALVPAAPLSLVAGVGIAVWFFVRTILK